jgi:hypothetical protein
MICRGRRDREILPSNLQFPEPADPLWLGVSQTQALELSQAILALFVQPIATRRAAQGGPLGIQLSRPVPWITRVRALLLVEPWPTTDVDISAALLEVPRAAIRVSGRESTRKMATKARRLALAESSTRAEADPLAPLPSASAP